MVRLHEDCGLCCVIINATPVIGAACVSRRERSGSALFRPPIVHGRDGHHVRRNSSSCRRGEHMVYPSNIITDLERALYLVERTVRNGLAHGHFECSIRGDLTGGGKRRLIITAATSHQFVIPPNDVEGSGEK